MSEKPSKILVVDDEEVLTTLICDYFEYHESGIVPLVTNDPHQVLSILEENKDIRLILSDFRMPGINGLELLLRVKARYPNMLFVMMTGYGTQELKKVGLQRGAIRYIEKPIDLVELAELIREELKEHASGFGGIVESVQLPDIIQLMGMSRRSSILKIVADQGRGEIGFRDGEVISAQCGKLIGEKAFFEILRWSGGRFAFAEPRSKMRQTITQSWQGLLLDSARLHDENKAGVNAEQAIESMFGEDDSDMPFANGSGGESAAIAQEPEAYDDDTDDDEDVISANVPNSSFDELFNDLIGELHVSALASYMETWPDNVDSLAFNSLPLNKLTVNIRRHFFFNFHLHWTRLIKKKSVPFDFTNENIAKALQNLLLTLRKNWIISKDEYREMLKESLRFELTQYIDPAKSLVLFIHKYTGGKAVKIKTLLKILIENKLIANEYESLTKDLGLLGVSHIRTEKLESLIRTVTDSKSESDNFIDFITDAKQLIQIQYGEGSDKSFNLSVALILPMLNPRGLETLSEKIQDLLSEGKDAFTVDELNELYENFQQKPKKK